MSEEFDLLKQVCSCLEKANIPYMLTGSFAANFYAVPRMTRDIDIVIEIKELDIEKFSQIFQDSFYFDPSVILEAIKYQGMFNLIHQKLLLKIDFIIRKNLLYRVMEFKRKTRINYNGIPLWIVSREDLIISKLYWAKDSLSEIQLKDIKNLLQNADNFDTAYFNEWVELLNLKSIFEKVTVNE